MSTLTEKARDEAEQAEVENPDSEEAAEDEETPPEPEPEPAGDPSEPTDRQLKSLDSEQRRHEERVRAIMGSFVEGFVACATCAGVGMVPQGPAPKTHEDFRACEICNGFGEVLTGSRNPQHVSTSCPRCGGRGYLERTATAQPVSAPQPAPASPQDEWGTPSWMGDPSVGR